MRDDEFEAFVSKAAECADAPVPSLLYVSSKETESRLGTFSVVAKWLSAQRPRADDVTVCTNSNFERCAGRLGGEGGNV